MRPDAGALRWGRSAFAALVCTLLAAGAHLSAGGRASTPVLLIAFVGTWSVAAGLAGRRLATSQLVGLLVIGQVVVHVGSPSAAAGHDATMIAAHLVGTMLSAWLLRRGEDSVWTFADRLGLRFDLVARLESVPTLGWLPLPVSWDGRRPTLLLAHVTDGRGPPVRVA